MLSPPNKAAESAPETAARSPRAHQEIVLQRDCEAIQIPYGNPITARAGTHVTVMHQLGDTFTIRTEHGYLLRIDGKDADALGIEPKPVSEAPAASDGEPGVVDEEQLWEQLRTCYDPEIPANIVDLGLIYACTVTPVEGGNQVDVKMTLTAPGCGMGQVLKDDVERKLAAVPGVTLVNVELVFSPPWDPSLMSEAARLQLGML